MVQATAGPDWLWIAMHTELVGDTLMRDGEAARLWEHLYMEYMDHPQPGLKWQMNHKWHLECERRLDGMRSFSGRQLILGRPVVCTENATVPRLR